MIKTVLAMAFFLLSMAASGQDPPWKGNEAARNSVQLSFGGAGIYASVIYERLLVSGDAWSAGVKTGIGTTVSPALSPPEVSVPLGGFALYGKGNSRLDLSLAITPYLMWQNNLETTERYAELRPLIVPSVAYRHQKREGGFMFRAGLSSLIHLNRISPTYAPWIDLGVGYGF